MRIKKVRGHNRRHRQLLAWKQYHLSRSLDSELTDGNNRTAASIRIHPWIGFSRSTSIPEEPRGRTKRAILQGLLEITDAWKSQLDQRQKPFYLKIWLYEPRFSESQVVCAIGDELHFYDQTFFPAENQNHLPSEQYGDLAPSLSRFSWLKCLDELHYDNQEGGEDGNAWLCKAGRIHDFYMEDGQQIRVYSFRRGIVWLGSM